MGKALTECPRCTKMLPVGDGVHTCTPRPLARLAPDTQEYLLTAAVRYQLPRFTYGSGIVAGAVVAAWPYLSWQGRSVIMRDVQDAMRQGEAGHDCDREAWARILALEVGEAPT